MVDEVEPTEAAPLIPANIAAEMGARVDEWQKNPDALEKWLERELLIQLQINAAIANGTLAVPGKGGLAILARALRDFGDQAERVLAALRTKDED